MVHNGCAGPVPAGATGRGTLAAQQSHGLRCTGQGHRLRPMPHVQGPPPGCSRYTVKLRKPLGLVLQQDASTNNITVAEVTPEGAAAKTGLVGVVGGRDLASAA